MKIWSDQPKMKLHVYLVFLAGLIWCAFAIQCANDKPIQDSLVTDIFVENSYSICILIQGAVLSSGALYLGTYRGLSSDFKMFLLKYDDESVPVWSLAISPFDFILNPYSINLNLRVSKEEKYAYVLLPSPASKKLYVVQIDLSRGTMMDYYSITNIETDSNFEKLSIHKETDTMLVTGKYSGFPSQPHAAWVGKILPNTYMSWIGFPAIKNFIASTFLDNDSEMYFVLTKEEPSLRRSLATSRYIYLKRLTLNSMTCFVVFGGITILFSYSLLFYIVNMNQVTNIWKKELNLGTSHVQDKGIMTYSLDKSGKVSILNHLLLTYGSILFFRINASNGEVVGTRFMSNSGVYWANVNSIAEKDQYIDLVIVCGNQKIVRYDTIANTFASFKVNFFPDVRLNN